MGYVLRPLLLAAALFAIAAGPATAAAPRAQAAAQKHAEAALDQAGELRQGHGVRTGRELTDALRELALGARHLRGEDRAQALSLLTRPDDGDPETSSDERFASGLPVSHECSASFCVHYVSLGEDAATAAQAALVLKEAEAVRAFEHGVLGWDAPPSDGGLGDRGRQTGKVDIYLKELGSRNLFG